MTLEGLPLLRCIRCLIRSFYRTPKKTRAIFCSAERELFSCDHCEAGRNLVEAWKLPHSLNEIVSRHHEPQSWREDDVLSIVNLSCRMAESLGFAAAHNLNSPTYPDLLTEIPTEERSKFPVKAEEMVLVLAAQINAIESA